jgi:uncharacterized Zn finger protein
MSPDPPPFPPGDPPIRVDGGLRARSRRGRIGESWWSHRFLAVLESFGLTGRLASGRRYARRGQVLALQIDAGEVHATVQGSDPEPYRVRLALPALPEPVWARVEAALATQALYSARLLAGEMPPELEQVFADAGAALFPRHRAELRMSCSCPDPVVPCKHLAATCYLLAEAFDEDPFRILRWRGRGRGPLLARLRELRAGPPAGDGAAPVAGSAPVAGAAHVLSEVTSHRLADDLDRFWLPPVPLPRRPATMVATPDLLLRQLAAPGAAIGGSALAAQLDTAYQHFAAAADPYRDGDSSQGSVRS